MVSTWDVGNTGKKEERGFIVDLDITRRATVKVRAQSRIEADRKAKAICQDEDHVDVTLDVDPIITVVETRDAGW